MALVAAANELRPKTDNADTTWWRGNVTVVTVPARFAGYQVRVRNRTWLDDGAVAFQCGGRRYSTVDGSLSLLQRHESRGTDSRLGSWEAVTGEWSAGACAELSTAIMFFSCMVMSGY